MFLSLPLAFLSLFTTLPCFLVKQSPTWELIWFMYVCGSLGSESPKKAGTIVLFTTVSLHLGLGLL